MAQVSNIKLKAKKSKTAGKVDLNLSFDLLFTPSEVRHKLQFGLYVMLYEVDHAPDILIPIPNGFGTLNLPQISPNNSKKENSLDDPIGWMKTEVIHPNGRRSLQMELNESVKLQNSKVSSESFRACIYIVPEISAGFAWSDNVKVVEENKPATNNEVVQQSTVQQTTNQAVVTSTDLKPTVTDKKVKSTKTEPIAKKTAAPKKTVQKNVTTKAKSRNSSRSSATKKQ